MSDTTGHTIKLIHDVPISNTKRKAALTRKSKLLKGGDTKLITVTLSSCLAKLLCTKGLVKL